MHTSKEYMGGLPLERKCASVVIFIRKTKNHIRSGTNSTGVTKGEKTKERRENEFPFLPPSELMDLYSPWSYPQKCLPPAFKSTYTRLTKWTAQWENSRERETNKKKKMRKLYDNIKRVGSQVIWRYNKKSASNLRKHFRFHRLTHKKKTNGQWHRACKDNGLCTKTTPRALHVEQKRLSEVAKREQLLGVFSRINRIPPQHKNTGNRNNDKKNDKPWTYRIWRAKSGK